MSVVHEDDDLVLLHVIEYGGSFTDPERGGRKHLEGWYTKAREESEDLFAGLTVEL